MIQRPRNHQGIPLPTGVAVVTDHAHGQRRGLAVMAYIGGRGSRDGPRRQKSKRFNPQNFPSMEACIAAAIRWRGKQSKR